MSLKRLYLIFYGNEHRIEPHSIEPQPQFSHGCYIQAPLTFPRILGMRLRRADSLMKNLKIVAYNFTGYTQQAGNQETYET